MGPQILGQLLKDLEPLMSQAAEDFEHEITCCQMEPQKAISGIGHQRCSTAGDSSRSDSISVPRRPLPTTLRRPRTSSFLEARRLRTVSGHETCSRDVPCSDKAGDRNAIPSTKSGDLIEAEPLCWTGLDFKNQPFRREALAGISTILVSWDGIWETAPDDGVTEAGMARKLNELSKLGKQILFVTNSSRASAQQFAQKLCRMGIGAPATSIAANVAAEVALEGNIISVGKACAWYLRENSCHRPFVLGSTALLDDLQQAGITNYIAPIDKKGHVLEAYAGKSGVTAASVNGIVGETLSTDAVVIGWEEEPTLLKVAVAAAHLWGVQSVNRSGSRKASRRPTRSGSQQSSNMAMGRLDSTSWDEVVPLKPLVLCCPQKTRRKVRALGISSTCRTLGTCLDPEMGENVRMPSRTLLEFLTHPVEKGGFGVQPETTMVIGADLSDVEFASESRMSSLLIMSRFETRQALKIETSSTRLPEWVVRHLTDI